MSMENYRDIFIEEAEENVNNLNAALLVFEKNIEDLTPVNELFRAAHTLKGMAATMGYDKLAEFTHMLEEALDGIRGGTVPANVEIINLLFKSIDTIEGFIVSIKEKNVDFSVGYRDIIENIKSQIQSSGAAAAPPPAPSPAAHQKEIDFTIDAMIVSEASKQGLRLYKIKVEISKACAFKNVRAFMATRNLSEKGEIVKSSPAARDIEEGNFESSFYLGYVTGMPPEDVKNLVMKIAEIENVAVEEVEGEKPAEAVQIKPAAAPEPAAKEEDKTAGAEKAEINEKKTSVSQSVRVNIEKLDALMNLVGELVITKIRLDQISREKQYNQLKDTVEEFDRIIDELQIEVTDVRMLPVSHVFDRFPRTVRDLANQAGKQIETEITGGDIEIDRTVLEEISEPLLHLIRNSVAHGIEAPKQRELAGKVKKGVIRLGAKRERNSVIIEVSDDGRGIDIEKVKKKAFEKKVMSEERIRNLSDEELVNLIAMPGFSTVEKTNQISGRGVGVDVVKTKVEAFGGIFRIENYPGEGVKFILKLPLTLAIIQALLVTANENIYALPVIHTSETLEIEKDEIKVIQNKRVIILREEVIHVVSLSELLGKPRKEKDIIDVVIVEARDKKVALEVEKVLGQQEVAIKSLGEFLKFAKGFSGVTILGDGRISLIIDIQTLLENMMEKEVII